MKIYFLKLSDFLNEIKNNRINADTENMDFKSQKRMLQHFAWRFLVTNGCKKFYNIENPEIIKINKKPFLKNNEIYFGITHSQEYVMAIFDTHPCAIDLEKIRPINLEKMSKRYNKNFETLNDFFTFWTQYESSIKLGEKSDNVISDYFENEYIYSINTKNNIEKVPIPINYF